MADSPEAPKSPWERKIEARRRRFDAKMARLQQRIEQRSRSWDACAARRAHFHTGFGGAIIGLILTGIGILLLLQNLGIVVIENLWDYWPVILIAAGISKLLNSWGAGGRIAGGIVAAFGTVFLLRNFGIIHGNVWGFFWPAILFAIGLGMLLRALESGGHPWAGPWRSNATLNDESTLNSAGIHAVFSHAERSFDTQQFEGGEVNAVFGGVELDLTRAAMKGDQARLECNAVFGGVEVTVPETWTVVMRGTGIFGGFSDRTVPPVRGDVKSPSLFVTGSAVFGGVTVKN